MNLFLSIIENFLTDYRPMTAPVNTIKTMADITCYYFSISNIVIIPSNIQNFLTFVKFSGHHLFNKV